MTEASPESQPETGLPDAIEAELQAIIAATQSINQPASPEQGENLAPTEVKFVFCEHTPENAPQITEQLKDQEVILVELLGESLETRKKFELVLNARLAGLIEESTGDPFFDALTKDLAGQGKAMKLIDMPGNTEELSVGSILKTVDVTAPLEELKSGIVRSAEKDVQIIRNREKLVEKQIEAAAKQYPGRRIGVIQGAAHSPVYMHTDLQHDKSVKMNRVFVGGPEVENTEYFFDYDSQLLRTLNLDKEVGPTLLNRVALQDLTLMSRPENFDVNHVVEHIQRMDDQEVSSWLGKFESVKVPNQTKEAIETNMYKIAEDFRKDSESIKA